MYLDLLIKYKKQHGFKLYSYILLPDRLHLLVEPAGDATISEIMHDLNSLYTKYFNGRYQRRGHLFEARFKSILVEKAQYLLRMTRLVHRLAADPIQHPHSSYHFYVGASSDAASQGLDISGETAEVLSFLRAKDDRAVYEKYCLQGDHAEIEELEKKIKRGSILGSEAFTAEVKNRIQEQSETKTQAPAASKSGMTVIAIVGAIVLVAASSSVYLYISKQALESKYEALLKQKDVEFTEKTKFENRSPLALTELEGTEWRIEMISLPADKAKGTVKDTVYFENGRFRSQYFENLGFASTNFSMTAQPNGIIIWETLQSNAAGDTVSWRGDWQGDVMRGILSHKPARENARDFSFFSVQWSPKK